MNHRARHTTLFLAVLVAAGALGGLALLVFNAAPPIASSSTEEPPRIEPTDPVPREIAEVLDVDRSPPKIEVDPGVEGHGNASLFGLVVDAEGVPSRATLSLLQLTPQEASRTASSDELGRFEVNGLESGDWRVTARSADGLAQEIVWLGRGSRAEVGPLVLVRSAGLTGQVVGPAGEPVVGAQLEITTAMSNSGELGRRTTDSRGRFDFGPVPPGSHGLKVAAAGYRMHGLSWCNVDPVRGAEHTVILERGLVLRSQVVDEHGKPIVGATVSAPSHHATTDAGGWFELSGESLQVSSPSRFRTWLNVVATGWVTRSFDVDPLHLPRQLRMSASPRFHGRAVEELTGKPAQVTNLEILGEDRGHTWDSDDRGDFSFFTAWIPPKEITVYLEAKGFCPVQRQVTTMNRAESTIELGLFEMKRADPFAIKVVDAEGPVPEAEVTLVSRHSRLARTAVHAVDEWKFRHGSDYDRRFIAAVPVACDAKGVAHFDSLWPGRYKAIVRAPGFAETVEEVLAGDPTNPVVTLELDRGGAIEGRVEDSRSGEPVVGFKVAAVCSTGFVGRTVSGADGSFRLTGLTEGTYAVTACPADSEPMVRWGSMEFMAGLSSIARGFPNSVPEEEVFPLAVRSGREVSTTIRVRRSRRGALRGKVTVDGSPAPGMVAQVISYHQFPKAEPLEPGVLHAFEFKNPTTTTDGRGSFLMTDLQPGTCRFLVSSPDLNLWQHAEGEILDGGIAEVSVDVPTASLEGKLVDRKTDQPIAGARVRLRREPQDHEYDLFSRWAVSDAGGSFGFPRMTPFLYRLDVTAPGYQTRQNVELRLKKGDQDFNLELVPGGWCYLKLEDPVGAATAADDAESGIHPESLFFLISEQMVEDQTRWTGFADRLPDGRYPVELDRFVRGARLQVWDSGDPRNATLQGEVQKLTVDPDRLQEIPVRLEPTKER